MTVTSTTQSPDTALSPHLIAINASGTWRGLLRTDLTASGRGFATAEPLSFGGDDSAPTPMDYVVGAFLGCITVIIELVARERDIRIDAIELDAAGTIDVRGVTGHPGISPSFQSLGATVRLDAGIHADALEPFVAEVERRCPAFNLFRDAGVTPQVNWVLNGVERGLL